MSTLQALPLPSSFEDVCELFLLYIAYSTLGWCGEMLYCSIPKGHICEKRGFLNGFLCAVPTARRDAYRPRSAPLQGDPP